MTLRFECHEVCFEYPGGHRALDGVSLSVKKGEVVGIIGPNGAGKSTLLRLAAGLRLPSRGTVHLTGKNTTTIKPRTLGTIVGYVPQSFVLPFSYSVLDVVLQGRVSRMGHAAFETSEDLDVAKKAMEQTGVSHLGARSFDALSGGERQRVVFAAALAQEPLLMVLDEPTSSLDLRFQASIVRLVRTLAGEQSIAVLVALHDLNLASALCDRLVLLVDGRARAQGSPNKVLTKELLEDAYNTRLHVAPGPAGPFVLPEV